MIRITAYATNDVDDVSSLDAMKVLQKAGIQAKRVKVTKVSQKQYDKAMDRP